MGTVLLNVNNRTFVLGTFFINNFMGTLPKVVLRLVLVPVVVLLVGEGGSARIE